MTAQAYTQLAKVSKSPAWVAATGALSFMTGAWLIGMAMSKKAPPVWYLWVAGGSALIAGASNLFQARVSMSEAAAFQQQQQQQLPQPQQPQQIAAPAA
jgi:hypothetical protein